MTFLKFLGLMAAGLLSGAFIYTVLNVIPAFYEVPPAVHLAYRVQLMGHNGITMQTLMSLCFITPVWYAALCRKNTMPRNLALLSAGLALATFLVTRFGNVPINQVIRTWPPAAPPADWLQWLRQWDIYHLLRTGTALGCFIAFMGAVHLAGRRAVHP